MLRSSIVTMALAASRLVSAATITEVLQENQATLSTLTDLLGTVPAVVDTLLEAEGITILAPSNDAFSKLVAQNPTENEPDEANIELLTMLLTYHVLNGTFNSSTFSTTPLFAKTLLEGDLFANVTGGGQNIELVLSNNNDATIISGLKQTSIVVVADIPFDGGVIHVIDTVLNIPSHISTTAITVGYTALAGAIVQADMIEDVDLIEDLTVFAPNNDAFAAIASAAETLTNDELSGILRYHLVRGKVAFSPSLVGVSEQKIMTLAGEEITMRSINGELFVNQAKVLTADIIVGNGVVHVIDSVLNPEAPELAPEAASAIPAVGFEGVTAGDVPFTSNVAVADEGDIPNDTESLAASSSLGLSTWMISLLIGTLMIDL